MPRRSVMSVYSIAASSWISCSCESRRTLSWRASRRKVNNKPAKIFNSYISPFYANGEIGENLPLANISRYTVVLSSLHRHQVKEKQAKVAELRSQIHSFGQVCVKEALSLSSVVVAVTRLNSMFYITREHAITSTDNVNDIIQIQIFFTY